MSQSSDDDIFHFPTGLEWLVFRFHLLHGGGGIGVQRMQDGVWRLWTDALSSEQAEAIVALHRQLRAAGQVLKDDVKRTISEVPFGGRTYVVKEYRKVFHAYFSPDERGWLCGNRLRGAVRCLAWKRMHNQAFIIMESAGPRSLDFRDAPYSPDCMLPKFRRAAQLMAILHKKGIFHVDLKPSNFVMASPDSTDDRLTIIDCDDVRHHRHLPMTLIQRNFIQFFGGLAYAIRDNENRLAFAAAFKEEYFRQMNLPADAFVPDRLSLVKYFLKLYPKKLDNFRVILHILFS